jgi:4-diphosphocytidyl-2C-methyl-D-erythritol kinase
MNEIDLFWDRFLENIGRDKNTKYMDIFLKTLKSYIGKSGGFQTAKAAADMCTNSYNKFHEIMECRNQRHDVWQAMITGAMAFFLTSGSGAPVFSEAIFSSRKRNSPPLAA